MPDIPSHLPPFALPDVVPEHLPRQQFQLGEQVRWRQISNPDFGHILGVVYTHSASCSVTGLHYLILLDQQSPSHSITHYDFAFEEDIEPLNPPPLA